MNKNWYKSKTVYGLILTVVGLLWGVWSGESAISETVVVAGLGLTGYGYRSALK